MTLPEFNVVGTPKKFDSESSKTSENQPVASAGYAQELMIFMS